MSAPSVFETLGLADPKEAAKQRAINGCVVALTAPFIAALLIWLGWNYGIANLVEAAGGHVGHIGYWVALFLRFFITTVSQSTGFLGVTK